MTDTIKAPWTEEQVEMLQAWQDSPAVHPFTCGNCRDADTARATSARVEVHDLDPEHELVEGDVIPGLPEYAQDAPDYDERALVPTVDGWVCPTCDYTQNWAHAGMFSPIPQWGAKKIRTKKPKALPPEDQAGSGSSTSGSGSTSG